MDQRAWPEEIYRKASINNLILLSFWSLGSDKKISFERLLEQCFHLFPKKFSFSDYKKWPDSRKLDRPLRNLRAQKLVKYRVEENKAQTFFLSQSGKKKATEIMNLFRQRKLILK